jgi:hypothetical protein
VTQLQKILLILASTVLWPAIHIVVFMLRFPQNPVPYGELLGFVLVCLIPGVLVAKWLQESKSRIQRIGVLLGYVVASPFAFLGSLGGGLFLTPWLGATIFGGIPLLLGSALGFWLGGRLTRQS